MRFTHRVPFLFALLVLRDGVMISELHFEKRLPPLMDQIDFFLRLTHVKEILLSTG